MKKCSTCQKDYQESTEEQKYCDRSCKRAASRKMTREDYLRKQQEREERWAKKTKEAAEAGYGNCVIFRDDGGYNRQYLCRDGTWTVNRAEAARCLDWDDANKLAEKHGVRFFGRFDEDPTCDILSFRWPEDYDYWLKTKHREIDAPDPYPTERFMLACFERATKARLYRIGRAAAAKEAAERGE